MGILLEKFGSHVTHARHTILQNIITLYNQIMIGLQYTYTLKSWKMHNAYKNKSIY